MNSSSPHPKHQRGRPKADDRRKVADDIFAAAKRCVERKGFTEVTLREIAEEAGTDHATINYYYGSRDKLMLEIVDEAIGEALQGFRQLRDEIRANPDSATRAFLAGAQGLILRHAPAVRIFFSEIIRGDDSAIRSYYNERWSPMWTQAFGDIIKTAIECGVYRQDVDADRIAFLLKGLAIYTLLKPQASEADFMLGEFDSEGWLELVAQIMDAYLRQPPQAVLPR